MKHKNINKNIIWVKKMLNIVFDFLFPEKCVKCFKKDKIICDDCVYTLLNSRENIHENIFSVFSYKDPYVKKILINLKYFNRKSFGEKLGEILYERFLEEISEINIFDERKIILIPIPMTKKRLRIRGYNQSFLIAKSLYETSLQKENIFELENNILIKIKETERQAKIKNRKIRLENLRGSFSCINTEKIKGRAVIIVDDISTTGATIKEAMRVLKKSGAKRVFGFVVAH